MKTLALAAAVDYLSAIGMPRLAAHEAALGHRLAPGLAALPTPLPDPFYRAPANLDKKRNGDILAARSRSNPPGFFDVRTYQLSFRSSDSLGQPIAAVTTARVNSSRDRVRAI